MASDRLDWFKLHVHDWLGSDRMRPLRAAERGLFIELLCRMWANREDPGFYRADPETLSYALHDPPEEIATWIERLISLGLIERRADGALGSRKLMAVYTDATAVQRRRAEAGRKGGRQSQAKRSNAKQSQALLDGAQATPSKSSREEEIREEEKKPPLPPQGESGVEADEPTAEEVRERFLRIGCSGAFADSDEFCAAYAEWSGYLLATHGIDVWERSGRQAVRQYRALAGQYARDGPGAAADRLRLAMANGWKGVVSEQRKGHRPKLSERNTALLRGDDDAS